MNTDTSNAEQQERVRCSALLGVAVKLSKTQQELYDALNSGVICYFMPYRGRFNPNAYYFRKDNHKRCTAAAQALLEKGLAERFDTNKYNGDHKLRVATPNGADQRPGHTGGSDCK